MSLVTTFKAYHNELVNKVSRLEEENLKLKKEKVSDLFYVSCVSFVFFEFWYLQVMIFLLVINLLKSLIICPRTLIFVFCLYH